MGGPFALGAQVSHVAGDPSAKTLPPQAVDECSGREGILRRRNPVGQIEPAGSTPAGVQRGQELGHAGLNDIAGIILPVSPGKNPNHSRLYGLGHQRDVKLIRQPVQPGLLLSDLFLAGFCFFLGLDPVNLIGVVQSSQPILQLLQFDQLLL